jgi:hypothetical protein
MKTRWFFHGWLGLALVLCGCGTYARRGVDPPRARALEQQLVRPEAALARELEVKILSLDPLHVTERDIREVLAQAPAPRIILIHGGLKSVIPRMVSFAEFLMGMGYPGLSLTNLADGTHTFSCYERSDLIAGTIAWYYEKEGMRPMMVGHSQGAMQVIKVLYKLDGPPSRKLAVWNPLAWRREARHEITDPQTGALRPVVGLRLPYATGMGGGGLTRLLPNQWDMCGGLRTIPDSVEEFTSFYVGKDLLGGDFVGYGPANLSKAKGQAAVRNVRLPTAYKHDDVPDTKHLLRSQPMRDWINAFDPAHPRPSVPDFAADSRNILWAADVWHSIKKHWVLELQRAIRARRTTNHVH